MEPCSKCGLERLCGIVGCFLRLIRYQYFFFAMGLVLCIGTRRLRLTYAGISRTLSSYVLPAQICMPFLLTPPRVPACYDQIRSSGATPFGGYTGMLKNQFLIRAVPRSLSSNRTYVSDGSVKVRHSGRHGSTPSEMTVRLVCQAFVASG